MRGVHDDPSKAIREFVVANFLFGDGSKLTGSQSLLRTGIVDSTGVMELIAFLEETFGIEIADADVLPENLDSLEAIERFVARRRPGPGSASRAAG